MDRNGLTCRDCGSPLPFRPAGPPPKWCDERCRARFNHRPHRKGARVFWCDTCARPFSANHRAQFCSGRCANFWRQDRRRPRVVRCADCRIMLSVTFDGCVAGDAKIRPLGPSRCERCRGMRRADSNRRKSAKRRGCAGSGTYTLTYVAERDGWSCHLCGERVDRRLPGTNEQGPTIDHLVPISDGGEDTAANVRLAHRSCNRRRGVGGTVQLLLVG